MNHTGLLTVISAGATINHYLSLNLTSEAKICAIKYSAFFSEFSNNCAYLYLGVSLTVFFGGALGDDYSIQLILLLIPIVIISRAIPMMLMTFFINKCSAENKITKLETLVLIISGLGRGAICFGLTLNLNNT